MSPAARYARALVLYHYPWVTCMKDGLAWRIIGLGLRNRFATEDAAWLSVASEVPECKWVM